MRFVETFRFAMQAVLSHRMRSLLTTLGIGIGIAAVILTVGLGQGAQQKVKSQISALGTNLLVITPGSSTTGGVRGGLGSAATLTLSDAGALADPTAAPDILAVAPAVQSSKSLTVGTTNWTTSVVGTTPNWLNVRGRTLLEGRFLTQADVDQVAPNVVLGPTTVQQLFGRQDPLGQPVTIGGTQLTVVGVLASSGSSDTTSLDDTAIVPETTGAQRLFGGSTRTAVQSIYVSATSSTTLPAAYQEARTLLLNLHAVSTADFSISSQESLLSTATSVDQTLTVLLGGVAALSLLVGGIGVMNIMLVSVSERIREIGLRKALGAAPRLIRRQFLVEASVLGLVGGLGGAALGVGAGAFLPHVISDPVHVSPAVVVGAVAISLAIGLLFGVYPASRAARLTPIEALRSE
ncbi:MAG TPA: ABC transporter permease [Frankiaceae bacterium]